MKTIFLLVFFFGFTKTQVFVNEIRDKNEKVTTSAVNKIREKFICPGNDTSIPLFTFPCEKDSDCSLLASGFLCCERKDVKFKRCLKGLPKPKPEQIHSPWLRVFPRKCPQAPIAEIREIKNCTNDTDCAPRICCPEPGTSDSYCRTAEIQFDNFPTIKRFMEPVTSLLTYVQCVPSTSSAVDLFTRPCNSILDCIPNLCCQERGRRVCRPPRQSLLTFLVGFTGRIATASNQMTNNILGTVKN